MSKKDTDEGKRYIRVRKDGFLYEYNELLANNPGCEVVEGEMPTEETPKDNEDDEGEEGKGKGKGFGAKGKHRKSGLDLSTDLDPHETDHAALSADASRNLPK